MSFSDFILAIFVLIGAACVIWILDLNPYSKQLQVYSQTCDNMILENTYCKGTWQDNPISIYNIDEENKMVTQTFRYQSNEKLYMNCTLVDRKNWSCLDETTNSEITVENGKIIYKTNSDIRQITRLEWLQNKVLEFVN